MFERFGISAEAEAVYRHLLLAPNDAMKSVVTVTGQESSAIETTLSNLIERGIVRPRPTMPLGCTALPPEQALEVLISQEETRLEEQRQALHAARDDIPALVQDYVAHRSTGVGTDVEYLEDVLLVRSRLYQLANETEKWIWSTQPGAALTPDAIEPALVLDRASSARGTDHRMLVSLESLGPDHWNAYLEELIELGHSLRVMPAIPLLCLVFDGKHAVIPGKVTPDGPSAYVLHGEHLVAPIVSLYEELWSQALRFGDAVNSSDDGHFSGARMKQVAVLLARGFKDDSIARRLGISVRTVRRIIAALTEHLKAESRFQAGYLAAQAEWIDDDRTLDSV